MTTKQTQHTLAGTPRTTEGRMIAKALIDAHRALTIAEAYRMARQYETQPALLAACEAALLALHATALESNTGTLAGAAQRVKAKLLLRVAIAQATGVQAS